MISRGLRIALGALGALFVLATILSVLAPDDDADKREMAFYDVVKQNLDEGGNPAVMCPLILERGFEANQHLKVGFVDAGGDPDVWNDEAAKAAIGAWASEHC